MQMIVWFHTLSILYGVRFLRCPVFAPLVPNFRKVDAPGAWV